jgi:hypothetical protein
MLTRFLLLALFVFTAGSARAQTILIRAGNLVDPSKGTVAKDQTILVECWPWSEREMSAMSILSKSSLCPNCANAATHRARRRGLLEHILHVVFFVSPLRCEVCDERYFRVRFLTPRSVHKHRSHAA